MTSQRFDNLLARDPRVHRTAADGEALEDVALQRSVGNCHE